MAKLPAGNDIHVDCGSSIEIEAYDEHGNKITYRIIARPGKPNAPGGPQGGGNPGPGPDTVPGPVVGNSVVAEIMTSDGVLAEQDPVADVYLNSRLVSNLVPGARRNAVVWQVQDISGGQVTLSLPEELGGSLDHMLFVAGIDEG
ncbi:MAG TPA: hypothetical protein VGP26_25120 [Actinophytocola sp.]|jgi:hypothetical protein|nr:hypothetical protein [Actinophytocola sp.]